MKRSPTARVSRIGVPSGQREGGSGSATERSCPMFPCAPQCPPFLTPLVAGSAVSRQGGRTAFRRALLAGSVVAALNLTFVTGSGATGARAAQAPRMLIGQTPNVVVHGEAHLHGHHDPKAIL